MVLMNPLELFKSDEVTDVLVDSVQQIKVVANSQLSNTDQKFESEEAVRDFAKTIVRENFGRIDIAKPYAEVNLDTEYGRLRVHCVLGGQVSEQTHISIRRHPLKHLLLSDLLNNGALTKFQFDQLIQILQDKQSFVIIGPTGSGKTTLLRAMLIQVSQERIITIEDSPELQIPNSVSLFCRERNTEGQGLISLQQLVRESLRMRPDRIVIGEARGEELFVLLQAFNTGHTGGGFTLHANGSTEALTRMQTLLCLAGAPEHVASQMIKTALEWVIELDQSSRLIAITKLELA